MLKRYGFLLLVVCVWLCLSALAWGAEAKPGWEATARTFPTNLPPNGKGIVKLMVFDTGAESSTAGAVVTDALPPGLTFVRQLPAVEQRFEGVECAGATVVTCKLPVIETGWFAQLQFEVNISGAEATSTNRITVAGGGAPTPASAAEPIHFASSPPGFGFANFDTWMTNADGTADTQAGSHPYELTVMFDMNNVNYEEFGEVRPLPSGGKLRATEVNLPPGIVGDPNAVPQCTRKQFDEEGGNGCSASTQIGVEHFGAPGFSEGMLTDLGAFPLPIYNMVPPPGVPAQFAFTLDGVSTFLDAGVRSGGDYGITEHTDNINEESELMFSATTIWGVPAEASHDTQRTGANCSEGCASSAQLRPLLTLPTSCTGPQTFGITGSRWEVPVVSGESSVITHDNQGNQIGFTGCDHLGFSPTVSVAPDTSYADTPAGLTVEVKTPQEGLTDTEGLGVSNIQDTTVTLPEGVAINPGQAAGLQACGTPEDALGRLPDGGENNEAPTCPAASKVGTVAIETPLLKDKLEGNVYILQSNPPNLQLLVAASGDGVNLKLVGDVQLDPVTGRLTSTFTRTPELPFTDLKLSFSGGAQAALSTPLTCGTYTTTSDFAPWSSPLVGDAFPSSGFAIDHGSGGGPCASPLPFSPSMIAGSTTDQAAGYTDFSLLLQRADGQQRISQLQFKTPEGLLGMISKVPLCQEPQAAAGTCSSASQIGHTVVESGPGPYPLVVPQPGQPPAPIYLTGGYKGAPYGLSIVVPLVVGPFTLDTQVVRAKIEVDPHTARLTVTTDPLPTIIDGVPADLRTINAVIDRPGFMFNPTNCSPQSFSGAATSNEGESAPLESHFQMGSCQSLSFKPNFKVATAGRTSRKNGASLDVKLLYPSVPPGHNQASSQSNIQSVKVDLPKQLPSRLTTLQKACPVARFNANPASCPKESIVGQATAITPVLPVSLSGPAYFVSHAGEEFPQLIIVLQGYGVTIDLVGNTFISKAGITSSTFKQIPDVPITSFELKLPQGPFSALAANANLCKAKLAMPTAFTAQDGAVIHQSTPIGVSGCAKAKKKTKRAGHGGGKQR